MSYIQLGQGGYNPLCSSLNWNNPKHVIEVV